MFKENDNSDNLALELEEFVKFSWNIGIKDRNLAKKLFMQMDSDQSGEISF